MDWDRQVNSLEDRDGESTHHVRADAIPDTRTVPHPDVWHKQVQTAIYSRQR